MTKRFMLFLTMALFLIGLQAFTQEPGESELYDMSLEQLLNMEVVTASQKAQKIGDAPATVKVITGDQIEKYGWRDLKDVFKAMPGIDVSYDVQGEVRSLVIMRGVLGNQKLLVLQDGQRMNPITGERFVYGHNMPLHLYKRIEIVYGPASALYGADAYAGVINMITKDGADIDGIEVGSGYISTGAFMGDFTYGKKLGDETDVVISGRVYNGKDFDFHKHYKSPVDYGPVSDYSGHLGAQDKEYPIKNWNLFSKIKYKAFTIGFDWQHEYETNALSCIPANYAYIDENVWGQDLRHGYIEHQTIKNEKFGLKTTLSAGDYTVNPASNFTIPNGTLDDYFNGYKYAYSGYLQGKLQADYSLSENISIVGGISYTEVRSFPKTKNLDNVPFSINKGLEDDLSAYIDSNGYVYGKLGLTDTIFGERNYNNLGSFLQGQIKFLDNLTLTIGGRFDNNSIYGSTINPRVGLVYKPLEKVSIKGLFGTAYIQPSNYYRWENWANPYAMHIPNEDIEPEKIQTSELSLSYMVNEQLSFRTSIFRNDMTDIIRPVPADAQEGGYPYYNPLRTQVGEDPSSGFVEINDNLGEMYTQGTEIEANIQVYKFLISTAYSYIEGENTQNKNKTDVPKISTHKAHTNVSFHLGNFFCGFTGRYYSDIFTAPSNSYYGADNGQIPGSFIAYGNIGYRLFNKLKINVGADNILGTKHYGAAPYGESVWIQPRAPQALRKIYGGITYKF